MLSLPLNLSVFSNRAKAEAKAKKIKRKNDKHQRNVSLSLPLSLAVNGRRAVRVADSTLKRTQCCTTFKTSQNKREYLHYLNKADIAKTV